MDTNEPGREPTEPTDAELELVLDLYRAAKRLAGNKTLADVQAVIDATNEVPWSAMKRLSGARPMPDTPAPDEVGQLRAEVLRVTHAYEQVCMGIQKLRDAADLSTARVAELEAEVEAVKADKISVWAALLATGKVIEEELMRLAGPEPSAEMVGGPTHTTPGKEPTSE